MSGIDVVRIANILKEALREEKHSLVKGQVEEKTRPNDINTLKEEIR